MGGKMLPLGVSHPLVAHFNWQFGGGCQQETRRARLAGSVEGLREEAAAGGVGAGAGAPAGVAAPV